MIIKDTVLLKKVSTTKEYYKVMLALMSALGAGFTKVQIEILTNISLNHKDDVLTTEIKRNVATLSNTTLQVVENTLVGFRKKNIIDNNNKLVDRWKLPISDQMNFTVKIIQEK